MNGYNSPPRSPPPSGPFGEHEQYIQDWNPMPLSDFQASQPRRFHRVAISSKIGLDPRPGWSLVHIVKDAFMYCLDQHPQHPHLKSMVRGNQMLLPPPGPFKDEHMAQIFQLMDCPVAEESIEFMEVKENVTLCQFDASFFMGRDPGPGQGMHLVTLQLTVVEKTRIVLGFSFSSVILSQNLVSSFLDIFSFIFGVLIDTGPQSRLDSIGERKPELSRLPAASTPKLSRRILDFNSARFKTLRLQVITELGNRGKSPSNYSVHVLLGLVWSMIIKVRVTMGAIENTVETELYLGCFGDYHIRVRAILSAESSSSVVARVADAVVAVKKATERHADWWASESNRYSLGTESIKSRGDSTCEAGNPKLSRTRLMAESWVSVENSITPFPYINGAPHIFPSVMDYQEGQFYELPGNLVSVCLKDDEMQRFEDLMDWLLVPKGPEEEEEEGAYLDAQVEDTDWSDSSSTTVG